MQGQSDRKQAIVATEENPSSKKQKYYGCFRAVYCFPNKYAVPFSLMEKILRGRIALRKVVDVIQSFNHKR